MKRKYLCIFVIILLVITLGCKNTDQLDEQLTNKVYNLEHELDEFKIKVQLLEEENRKLKEELNESEVLHKRQTDKVFDPNNINIGDEIGGYMVADIMLNEYGMEKVVFDGLFIMTGELVINVIGESQFGLICKKDEIINNLPISANWKLHEYNNDYKQFFRLLSDEKVIEEIGENRSVKMTDSIANGLEYSYRITAVFNKFTYWSQPNTDISSAFELVSIISIEELN